MASVRQSSMVCRTIGCSIGIGIGPGGRVSPHAATCGKAAASRSPARMRRMGAGIFFPLREPVEQERPLRVPSPAGLEHGRVEHRLHQDVARGVGMQVVEDLRELEAVLRAEGEDDGLLVGRGLELEAESRRRTACAGPGPRPC
jgi:hypothetical protein